MRTRTEHIEWTKTRALGELDAPGTGYAGIVNAIASVTSDLGKHPDTRGHAAIELMTKLALAGHMSTAAAAREFIDGIQ